MGNNLLPLNRIKYRDRSKYSHIDKKTNGQKWLQDSQVDEWDSAWKDVTHQNVYYRIEYGKFNTFRNDITLEEVQRYRTVLNDKHDFQKWKQMIEWRNNCQYLVKIQHFSLQNQGEMCVSQFEVNAFVQRIPLRLADLTDIPYPQNLYFLLCVIKGFKYIFSSPYPIKNFKITESMICVNKEGQVKVWLNPNLSEFEPVNSKQTAHVTQQDILRSLIDIVQQNTDQKDYPHPFRQYLHNKNILINGDYNIIIQQLYNYARDMKVMIPKYAFSVRDILTKDIFQNTKLQSENSIQNKVQFNHQHPQMKRDNSLSVINSFQFRPHKKEHVYYEKQASKAELFPKEKTHGLISASKMQDNISKPSIPLLPSYKANQNSEQSNFLINQTFNNQKQLSQEVKYPFTDRSFYDQNINGHLVRINRIGNNIVQFHQPDIQYRPNPIKQQNTIPNNQRRQIHSLEKPSNQQQATIPPGYKMVERKIIHPLNFNPNTHSQQTPTFYPPFNPHFQTNQPLPYQTAQNSAFQNIQRVNSTRIPISFTGGMNISRSYSIQNSNQNNMISTIRPNQISNPMKVERISRQSSQKTFSNHENNNEQMRKTNSFKNNLIKYQHEEKQVQRAVSNLKYFTKKDSQQTLDPEIAGDLLKYLNQQQN